MIGLDDSKWQTFNGGYRTPYDASVRLRELDSESPDTDDIWEELCDELHHQGGVDLASYAAVPQLVRICIQRGLLDWNAFALVAIIEECRIFNDNPELPAWLDADYHSAIKQLTEFGVRNFSLDWSEQLTLSFFAVAAFAKNLPNAGRLIGSFSDDELNEVYKKFFSD